MTVQDSPTIEMPTSGFRREDFVSPDILEEEMERIFRKNWMYVAHTSQLAKPGDFVRHDLAGESVIVVRTRSGELRALYNFCTHRGAQLLEETSGSCGRAITCTYHGWTFDYDGELRSAPRMQPDFDKTPHGLKHAWVDTWNGLVFVSLADERPPSVAERLPDADFGEHQLERAKVAVEYRTVIEANWKIVWENGGECYHCAINHPELGRVMSVTRTGASESHSLVADYRFDRKFPLLEGMHTLTMDGQFRSKRLLGDPDSPPEGMRFLNWHSSIFELTAAADHAHIQTFKPLSTTRTEVRLVLMVHADAVENEDYDAEGIFELHRIARGQDSGLCEKTQRGIGSRHYQPGPYNTVYEYSSQQFRHLYQQAMGQL
ncbi:aromatic ring-hydroxylating dioxygenase subunit alpha [Streptomyces sp. DSM 3412]|uniref:Aromatic ring-hydroxylating dioxygenase subunit alpha n=1 Tax=Streptomyces gottesmaniae TaxID=3075518 RepID=A0ABU2Z290_9ACTN|nr:aromatic ring-hydroxylating dioxygenase subunit alpha [Streptomyces sp. DSM 3412]MDT0570273.1 aromatic ring-hydroxylating dioxygenase subunit alpha [Streptomyces sp. DSM 3412]